MDKISLIIPCYNSAGTLEKNLPYLVDHLKTQDFESEVIVVDDGSDNQDETRKVAESNGCVFLSYPNNKGKGHAVRFGMQEASGDICIFTDADIPFETHAIDTIIHYLDEKEYDLAIGDRGLKESEYFSRISNKRRFGSGAFTFFVGRFVTTGFSDTQCGLKGFRREIAEDLFSKSRLNGFAFDVELVYISLKRNYDIKKIPVTLRSQDGNTVRVIRHGIPMLFDLFKIKLNHMRGYYRQ